MIKLMEANWEERIKSNKKPQSNDLTTKLGILVTSKYYIPSIAY